MAKNISCYLIRISCLLTCVCCFLSFCCTWLRGVCFYPLYNLWSGSCREKKCVSFPFSIPRGTVLVFRAFSCASCTPNPSHLCGLQWINFSLSISFFWWPEIDTTLNAALQVPKSSAGPDSYKSTKTALNAAGLHCCRVTLLGHVWLLAHKDTKINCFSDSQPWPAFHQETRLNFLLLDFTRFL